MAGGYGRGDQGSLAERVAASASDAPNPRRSNEHPARSPARHCSVSGEPALLVEWRQRGADWEGRVISMVWVDDGWATIERWVPAGSIMPT
jgi:hypothetical protein